MTADSTADRSAHRSANRAILLIAVAELLGTSLWFSANGAADDLTRAWALTTAQLGLLTAAVQAGFIAGTLTIALSGLADRFAASRIFAVAAVAGALCNAAFLLCDGVATGAAMRFAVGICLAGIYPLGMKLVVSWNPARAGTSLALLVGMLVMGTALPHGMRAFGAHWPWQAVVGAASLLAMAGAVLVAMQGDGPHAAPRRPAGTSPLASLITAWRTPAFRAGSLGYFGHMWELYAFWTLVPLIIERSLAMEGRTVSLLAFAIIAVGGLGCFAGGLLSRRLGSPRVAGAALAVSGACCLLFPWAATWIGAGPLLLLLVVWGVCVVADSPQFSAIAARTCPPSAMGSALAMQNAIGFAITLVSIALATRLFDGLGLPVLWLLLPGPIVGLVGLWPLIRRPPPALAPDRARSGLKQD